MGDCAFDAYHCGATHPVGAGIVRPYFVKMAQNNAWANRVLFNACRALSDEQVWAARTGFFGSIGKTLNHIYEVDLYYLDALEVGGVGRAVYNRDDIHDMSELHAVQLVVDGRLIQFCKDLAEATLTEMRETERVGEVVEERVDCLLLHLIQHDVHHRGQVHAMLSDAGVVPPQLDDFYLEFGRVEMAKGYWESQDG
jgi:uncharacterized damage-inducible protein DinB